jgi:hypothetical protein
MAVGTMPWTTRPGASRPGGTSGNGHHAPVGHQAVGHLASVGHAMCVIMPEAGCRKTLWPREVIARHYALII